VAKFGQGGLTHGPRRGKFQACASA
jgi:hypothetical protein